MVARTQIAGVVGALLLAAGSGSAATTGWQVAFAAEHDGDWGMFAVGQRGGAPVRFAAADAPLWAEAVASPDGRRLIVPAHGTVVLMTLDGGARTTIATDDNPPLGSTVWSPDSRRAVFVGKEPGLSVIDADGTGAHRLTRTSSDSEPAWSPDGNALAFIRGTGLMVVHLDGTHLRRLRRFHDEIYGLHWARDGHSIVVIEASGVVTVAAADGHVTGRVAAKGVGPPAWAPDGRRFAYAAYHGRSRIFLMNADGTSRRFLTYGYSPVWRPDGAAIAYLTERGDVASIRPDGTGERRLTNPGAFAPGWPGPVWVRGPITPAPLPHAVVAAPRADGAVLHTYFPVETLAAAGTRVALVSPQRMWVPNWPTTTPLVLWDARSGRIDRMSLTCQQPQSVAVLAGRVAYDCPNGHAANSDTAILTSPFRLGRARPVEVVDGAFGDGAPRVEQVPERLAGSGNLLVFSTSLANRGTALELWRADGGHVTRIARGPEAGEPVAADSGRVAIEQADGRVALLARDGRLLGGIAPGGKPAPSNRFDPAPPSVGLSGRDLVVLRGGRLSDYDTTSFRLRRSWRVGRPAQLGGVANGLVAYVNGRDVHLLRLRDARGATIHTRSRSAVKAALTGAGLFYVTHARPLPQVPALLMDLHPSRNPATVVYVRWRALIGRLG